jgi:hypothetical protein
MIHRMLKVSPALVHTHATCSRFPAVAKHYKTSRDSFNKTARYWAQAYAGAPLDTPAAASSAVNVVDDDEEIVVTGQRSRAVELAGLEQAAVNKFKAMGFPEDQIVRHLPCCFSDGS